MYQLRRPQPGRQCSEIDKPITLRVQNITRHGTQGLASGDEAGGCNVYQATTSNEENQPVISGLLQFHAANMTNAATPVVGRWKSSVGVCTPRSRLADICIFSVETFGKAYGWVVYLQ